MMILMKLVQRVDEARGVPARPISFAEIGDSFGVSRTHVRKLLQQAAAAELINLSGRTVVLTPSLLAAFDRVTADTLAGQDLMHRVAMQRLGAA